MKALVLTVILCGTMLSACEKPKSSSAELPPEIQLYGAYEPSTVNSQVLSKDYRIQATNSLFDSLRKEYAPWHYKRSLIGIDVELIAKQCVSEEMTVETSTRPEFVDRLRICLAKFRDTHLAIYDTAAKPTIITLIGAAMDVNAKWVVSSVRENLVLFWIGQHPELADHIKAALKIGNQIVSIDGIPANEYVATIGKSISGSSQSFVMQRAAERTFTRSFSYPNKAFIRLGISTTSGIVYLDMPWFYTTSENVEVNDLLSSKNMLKAEQVNNATNTLGFSPYYRIFATFEVLDLYKYATSKDEEGDFIFAGRPKLFPNTCYIKLSNFKAKQRVYAEDGSEISKVEAIRKIISMCESKTTQMILDLQHNVGGNSSNVDLLLSHLLPKTKEIYALEAPRVSPLTSKIFNGIINAYKDSPSDVRYYTEANSILATTLESNSMTVLPWLVARYGYYQEDMIYTKPVRVLTTPYCISACDEFVRAIKLSNRAQIIGTPTNGTGAGYIFVDEIKSLYSDEQKIFEINIPNEVFSVSRSYPKHLGPIDERYLMENRPTIPDITYRYTKRDLVEYYADLIDYLNLN